MKSRLGLTAGVAAVLIGGGIALGIAFAGGSSPAGHGTPTVVSPADEIVTDSSSISSSDPAAVETTPSDTATSSSPDSVSVPPPVTTHAPTPSTTNPADPVGSPGIVGNDGVLRPAPSATEVSSPCQTPYKLPGDQPQPSFSNPCP